MSIYKQPLHVVRPIKNLREMLEGSVAEFKDRDAFLLKPVKGEPYAPVSYEQFGQDVHNFGTGLYHMGIDNKQRVAILAETRYEWYVSYLSIVNCAGVVVPLDKELSVPELRNMLTSAKVTAVIYSPKLRESAIEATKDIPTLKFMVQMDKFEDSEEIRTLQTQGPRMLESLGVEESAWSNVMADGKQRIEQGDNIFLTYPIDPDEMRILLFTSGTTDKPKAVMHSHGTISANLVGMCEMTEVGGDTCLSILPLHHTYECTCGYLCQIYRGDTIAYCEGLRHITDNLKESETSLLLAVPLILETFHKRIWKNIDKQGARKKVNFALGLSRFLMKLGIDVRKKLFKDIHEAMGGHMRLIIAGGAAIDPKILKDFNDFGFLAIQGYGLTECGPILALNRDIDYKNESAGQPLPGTAVKVLNPDENGIGEFIGKGPNIMLGYYGDEAKTQEVLQDGWFHTGDLGYIDDDGFVIITGRKKNVIVTKNGKNVFPEELEFLLKKHTEVAEAVVSGAPDNRGDTQVVVEIFPNKEEMETILGKKDPSREEVQAHMEALVKEVNHQVSDYKAMRNVTIRDEDFVRNTSKKVVRSKN
jgi:long-chain acyl-CoA synthetase